MSVHGEQDPGKARLNFEIPTQKGLISDVQQLYEQLNDELFGKATAKGVAALNVAQVIPQLALIDPSNSSIAETAEYDFEVRTEFLKHKQKLSSEQMAIMSNSFALAAERGGVFKDLALRALTYVPKEYADHRAELMVELAASGDEEAIVDAKNVVLGLPEIGTRLSLLHELDAQGYTDVSELINETAEELYSEVDDAHFVATAIVNHGKVSRRNESTYFEMAKHYIDKDIVVNGDPKQSLRYVTLLAMLYRADYGDMYREKALTHYLGMSEASQVDILGKMRAGARIADLSEALPKDINTLAQHSTIDGDEVSMCLAEAYAQRGEIIATQNESSRISGHGSYLDIYMTIVKLGVGEAVIDSILNNFVPDKLGELGLLPISRYYQDHAMDKHAYAVAKKIQDPIIRSTALVNIFKSIHGKNPLFSYLY